MLCYPCVCVRVSAWAKPLCARLLLHVRVCAWIFDSFLIFDVFSDSICVLSQFSINLQPSSLVPAMAKRSASSMDSGRTGGWCYQLSPVPTRYLPGTNPVPTWYQPVFPLHIYLIKWYQTFCGSGGALSVHGIVLATADILSSGTPPKPQKVWYHFIR